jgi:hypothetical protein
MEYSCPDQADWRAVIAELLGRWHPGEPDFGFTEGDGTACLCAADRTENALSCRFACAAVDAENPEPPAHRTSELETRSGSALLEQDEARFGQHPLLPGGQAAAGLPSRQVADYLNDLDQIP